MQRTAKMERMRARLLARAFGAVATFGALFAIGAGAQTAQPYVFAGTVTSNQYGLMTLQRDDAMGTLTLLANTNATLRNRRFPSEVEREGGFCSGFAAMDCPCTRLTRRVGLWRSWQHRHSRCPREIPEFW
jgi:hypothetical protein